MSVVPYDDARVDAIATTLNLRLPNRNALDAIARELDARPEGSELVADLATGVGKTYIAGGLLDYLYESGVRNVVIVTPGSTIQRKTVANLTPGNSKYLNGLACDPLVITLDDFERGTVGAALDNPARFKVFVFTVQSLLRPDTKDNRRAHRPHEVLGQSLSDYLRAAEDLVVIADEHHVYFNKTANKFRAAIRDLDPVALIGLTATPHESTAADSIVFHYPLADAIADGYVKVPVLVARRDGKADLRTQMADGCALLSVKEDAMRAYVKATKQEFIQPMLFVVASTIDEANRIRDLLAGPDYLDGDDKVLLITSEEPDDVVSQLDTLERPGPPVKAVVSVQMLGIGWDVKNVYVIAAVRALESDLLTEQILGRGLRLPFGRRTSVPMLDTVEVLSHHAFSDLLAEAKVLLAQTLGQRAEDATATASTIDGVRGDQIDLDQPLTENPQDSDPQAAVSVTLPGPPAADDPDQGALLNPDGSLPLDTDDQTDHEVVGLSTLDARLTDGRNTTDALSTPVKPRTPSGTHLPLFIPKVTYKWVRESFSLTQVNLTAAEAQGTVWADDNAPTLKRKVLDAEREDDGTVAVHISDSQQTVHAATLSIPFNEIEADLVARLLRSNAIEQSVTEYNAAVKIAQAFLRGAQVNEDTPWRAEHGRLATEALVGWINTLQTAKPAKLVAEVFQVRWPDPPEVTETCKPTDRQLITSSKQFVRGYPYSGWTRSFYDVAAFDSYSAEFRLAETLDATRGVKAWQRITSAVPLSVPYRHGARDRQYTPDFIVIDDRDVRWIVEGKADGQMTDPVVIAKRDAAKQWVDAVNVDANVPSQWAYLLLPEAVIKNAPNWAALKAAGQSHG